MVYYVVKSLNDQTKSPEVLLLTGSHSAILPAYTILSCIIYKYIFFEIANVPMYRIVVPVFLVR